MVALIVKTWDSYDQRHYLALRGTKSALDGTVMATPCDSRPWDQQVRENLQELNARRRNLGLEEIKL